MLDAHGNRRWVEKYGKLTLTQHNTIMSALEKRALRFRRKGRIIESLDERLYNEAIDETGTVETTALTTDNEDGSNGTNDVQHDRTHETFAEYLAGRGVKGTLDDMLSVHGVAPSQKAEGVTRLIYENMNGIPTRLMNNEKLEKARELIDELGADIAAFTELQVNWRHKNNVNGLSQMFNGGESEVRSIAGHNVHESDCGQRQQGGTGLVLNGPLIEQFDFEASGKDDTGLGRWVTMVFRGQDGLTTRVICGYNPCKSAPKATRSSYQQHRRYFIRQEKDRTCPRKRFRRDLVTQLEKWRNEGDRLIVCMDANDNIYGRRGIGADLTQSDVLEMKEVVGDFTGSKLGATYFRGSVPIDAIWATPDVSIAGACVMPCGYGVGDHRLFCVDFHTSSLVGARPPRVLRQAARRLNTDVPHTEREYTARFEDKIVEHRLIERARAVHTSSTSKAEVKSRLSKIDREKGEYMAHAEKNCRRIKSGRIPFSPEASIWIRRTQVYRSLLRFYAGKIRNKSNLKRAARRCGIANPLGLSLREIRDRLAECKRKCNYFRKHGKRYRRKHLQNRLEIARSRNNEEAEKRILMIIQREKERARWRRLNFSMKKRKGRSVTLVTTATEDGDITEHSGQAAMQEAIWSEIHDQRFYLAEQAPICQGRLREDFGYLAQTQTAREVLAGTYVYPPDFDEATRELCEECARIRLRIPPCSVATNVTRTEWQERWAKAKEKTSSSISGLHFGHYIAGSRSPTISQLHALKVAIALRHGVALERWSRGLSVMLEKVVGCTLVTKLRAILLMEADFNFSNKLIYGVRMLNNVRAHGYMPEEIFSEQGRVPHDGTFSKTLFWDIARQSKRVAGLASIDAANCYDSVAHAIASLVFQAFGVPEEAISSMLTTIQDMKFFLRTAYGDSATFRGSRAEVKFQGFTQGNGASPAGWAVISIVIISAHKAKGHGAHFRCPVSKLTGHLAAILFVDDTDILHIRMDREESPEDAHLALQQSVNNWGRLLTATGGAFKPDKCFSYLISHIWLPDGRWKYATNDEDEQFDISVPMPDGREVFIEHASSDDARETLGVYTCPEGTCEEQLECMDEKGEKWVAAAREGNVRRRDIWFLLDNQLWPRLSYGLGAIGARWDELSTALQRVWYDVLPMGGVIRTARKPMRQLSRGFYGIGCPHAGVESLVQQTEKLLLHYGCRSSLGMQLKISLSHLILEMGESVQPLQESYVDLCEHVSWCWLVSLWEKCDKFGIVIEFHDVEVEPPRQGDTWLMKRFRAVGFEGADLLKLNRVRIAMQALYLSDVLGASGKTLDPRYLSARPAHEQWSRYDFPTQRMPQGGLELWRYALHQIAPPGGIPDRLGAFRHEGHKVWPWRLDATNGRLLHLRGDQMDVYAPSTEPRYANLANRWSRAARALPIEECGSICTIREVTPRVVAVVSDEVQFQPTPPPDTILEVLREWGCLWMWESMTLFGDDNWMVESIRAGSLYAVTDGSYIRERFPDLCSAAFVLECQEGRGRVVGSFSEKASYACAYRGELLGLLAIHLLLLAANRVDPTLTGEASVYSDCLGAISRVCDLPETRVPNGSQHSDILKTILIHCRTLSFTVTYSHVRAHQDDHHSFERLTRASQLNCIADGMAKNALESIQSRDDMPAQQMFPLEPVAIFVDGEKLATRPADALRYRAHYVLARETFHDLSVMFRPAFDQIAWKSVYTALHDVPRMFQVWAAKQVLDIAGTNEMQSRYKADHSPMCPSCEERVETCEHVLHCDEAGRVSALRKSIKLLDDWMRRVGTDHTLRECLTQYAYGRGARSMEECVWGCGRQYERWGASQDRIGWRRTLEGMISKEMLTIQGAYVDRGGRSTLSVEKWAQHLVIRLLEVTHGQWIYRNVQVHDIVSGVHATQRKEELRHAIEDQLDLGEGGLDEQDKWLLDINLEDLGATSGEDQYYWLLQIQAAREDRLLREREESERTAPEPQRREANT